MLLTHALALSASQFVDKKKSLRIDTSMHSGGLELTQLTYSRREDNLLHHPRPRHCMDSTQPPSSRPVYGQYPQKVWAANSSASRWRLRLTELIRQVSGLGPRFGGW